MCIYRHSRVQRIVLAILVPLLGALHSTKGRAANSDHLDLLLAAEEAYTSAFEAWTAGKFYARVDVDEEDIYRCSLRWMNASIAARQSREKQLLAARSHLERMTALFVRVKTLHDFGEDGPARSVAATRFYVAEASVNARSAAMTVGEGGAAEMVRSAQEAYEWFLSRWTFRTTDPERVYLWSKRWMKAACSTATCRDDQLAAANEHLWRMQGLLDKVARTKIVPGVSVAAAKYYVAEDAPELWLAAAQYYAAAAAAPLPTTRLQRRSQAPTSESKRTAPICATECR